jgi:hypothetical protein
LVWFSHDVTCVYKFTQLDRVSFGRLCVFYSHNGYSRHYIGDQKRVRANVTKQGVRGGMARNNICDGDRGAFDAQGNKRISR